MLFVSGPPVRRYKGAIKPAGCVALTHTKGRITSRPRPPPPPPGHRGAPPPPPPPFGPSQWGSRPTPHAVSGCLQSARLSSPYLSHPTQCGTTSFHSSTFPNTRLR